MPGTDKSPEALAKIKEAYASMWTDLPKPYKSQLMRVATFDELDSFMDSIVKMGLGAHFKVRDTFRGPKKARVTVWSEISSCGIQFQVGETYLVYASWDNQKASPKISRKDWQKAADSGITEFPHKQLRPRRRRLSP